MPPPVELFSPPLFAAGDLVQSIPDTTPGVHLSHSVAIVGSVTELKIAEGWLYHIKASNDGRNNIWVPECRLRPISKSIFDDCYIERRAGLQEQLTDERERAQKWKRLYTEVNSEVPVLEGELSRQLRQPCRPLLSSLRASTNSRGRASP
jgi:hypothetical protein